MNLSEPFIFSTFEEKNSMALGKFTKKVSTYLTGRTLQMFRFDCVDSYMGESPKLKQIINEYYRNKPPLGFRNQQNPNDK